MSRIECSTDYAHYRRTIQHRSAPLGGMAGAAAAVERLHRRIGQQLSRCPSVGRAQGVHGQLQTASALDPLDGRMAQEACLRATARRSAVPRAPRGADSFFACRRRQLRPSRKSGILAASGFSSGPFAGNAFGQRFARLLRRVASPPREGTVSCFIEFDGPRFLFSPSTAWSWHRGRLGTRRHK